MRKVKIFKIHVERAPMMMECGDGFSLGPWGDNTASYYGWDDGGKYYILPENYELSETQYGERGIYNKRHKYCEIDIRNDYPILIDINAKPPVIALQLFSDDPAVSV